MSGSPGLRELFEDLLFGEPCYFGFVSGFMSLQLSQFRVSVLPDISEVLDPIGSGTKWLFWLLQDHTLYREIAKGTQTS